MWAHSKGHRGTAITEMAKGISRDRGKLAHEPYSYARCVHTIRLARKIKFSRESASEPHLDMKGAELGDLAVGSVGSKRELSGPRHFERRRVAGDPATMTDTACSFVGLYQTCIADFVGIDHDFGRPVVSPSTVTRLALHSGQRCRSGGVTKKAARGWTLDAEASRGLSVCGRAPTHIGRTVTELAALRADEGGLVEAQTKEGKQQGETTSVEKHSTSLFPVIA